MMKFLYGLMLIGVYLQADFVSVHQWPDSQRTTVGVVNQFDAEHVTDMLIIQRDGLSMGWGSNTYDPNTLSQCVLSSASYQRLRVYLPAGLNAADIRVAAVPNASLTYAYKFVADDGSTGNIIDHTNAGFSSSQLKEGLTIVKTISNTAKILVRGSEIEYKSGWLLIEYASRDQGINMKMTVAVDVDDSKAQEALDALNDSNVSYKNGDPYTSYQAEVTEIIQLCDGSIEEVVHDLVNGSTSASNLGGTTVVTTTTPTYTPPVVTTPSAPSVAQETCIANGGTWEGICIGGSSGTTTTGTTTYNTGTTTASSGSALPADDSSGATGSAVSTTTTTTTSSTSSTSSTGSTSAQDACIASGGTWEGVCIGGTQTTDSKGTAAADLGEEEEETQTKTTNVSSESGAVLETFSMSIIKRSIQRESIYDGAFYNYGKNATDWIYVVEGDTVLYKLDDINSNGTFKWLKLVDINSDYMNIVKNDETLKFGSFEDTLDLSLDVKVVLDKLQKRDITLAGFFTRFGDDALDWIFFSKDGKVGAKLDGRLDDGSIRWNIIWGE